MKKLCLIALASGALAFAADEPKPACSTCKPNLESVALRPLAGTNENVLVGRIENLMPIGIVTVLGCEACAAEVVTWALAQGSPAEDVERALRSVATMRDMECFRRQFGPEAAGRMEKPLAAARRVLQQAAGRTEK